LFLRRHGSRLLPWADAAVPSVALGVAFTRIGCYLFGCDFGKPLPSSAPAWVARLGTFPRWSEESFAPGVGSPAWLEHVSHRGLSPDAAASLPVHPTQLYESLAGLVIFGLLLAVRRQQRFRGQVFLTFAFAYGALRFAIESLRDDPERGTFGPLFPAHVYLAVTALAFAVAYAVGPARSIPSGRHRQISRVLALLPAVAVLVWLDPPGASSPALIQLSTSQWIALASAGAAAFAWRRLDRAARIDPDAAMHLGPVPSAGADG
jgi:phosphatidylglycerol:prolipoprotein diacylglycerol transferase